MSAEEEFDDSGDHNVAKLSLDDNDDEDLALVKELQAKVAANPADVQLLAQLSRALADVGMDEEAVKAYDEALKTNPNSVPLLIGKAHALNVLGSQGEARTVLEAALKIDANNADALYDLGKLHQSDELHEKAKDAFLRAHAANPRHAGALFELGQYAMSGGSAHSAEAIKYFLASSESDANNITCWKNLGQLHQTAGDQKSAADFFRKASQLDPSDVLLRAKVMQCLDALNDDATRESFRQHLHDDYKAGVLNKNYTIVGRYNCGQFETGNKFIMAFDHFPAPNAVAVYTFYIYVKGHVHEDKVICKVTLSHEGGKYVLKSNDKPHHTFDAKPSYSSVKEEVLKIAAALA